jgi:hypothetical protein
VTDAVLRYCSGQSRRYKQTIGLDFYSKRLELPGGVSCTLQLWDIGGQSLAGKMINNYLEGADVSGVALWTSAQWRHSLRPQTLVRCLTRSNSRISRIDFARVLVLHFSLAELSLTLYV